jgi:RimJ/RimL family protein N-acetyltransferase
MTMLSTARLSLRQMTDADLDDMADLLGDERVMTHYPRTKSRPEAQSWIDWNRRLYHEHGLGLWVVALSESGVFLGDCGLTMQRVDGVDEVEIGYHIRPQYQGHGYATEAASACRDIARDHFSVSRLIAIIDPANRPSQAVAENIGLTVEKRTNVHGGERIIYAASL